MQLYSYSGLLRHLDSSNISFFQWAALSFPSTDGFANDKQGLQKWSRWDSRPRCWWPEDVLLQDLPHWAQLPGHNDHQVKEVKQLRKDLQLKKNSLEEHGTGRSPRATVVPIANPPTTKQRVFSSTRFLFFNESHPWGSCLISVFLISLVFQFQLRQQKRLYKSGPAGFVRVVNISIGNILGKGCTSSLIIFLTLFKTRLTPPPLFLSTW